MFGANCVTRLQLCDPIDERNMMAKKRGKNWVSFCHVCNFVMTARKRINVKILHWNITETSKDSKVTSS
jgi:hypothetical protein